MFGHPGAIQALLDGGATPDLDLDGGNLLLFYAARGNQSEESINALAKADASGILTPRHAYEVVRVGETGGQKWIELRNPHGAGGAKMEGGKLVATLAPEVTLPFLDFLKYFQDFEFKAQPTEKKK